MACKIRMRMALAGLIWMVFASAVAAQGTSWGAATNSTVINSKSMTFDYQKNVATFTGDVIVSDPTIKIMADTMVVEFDENKNPKTVTADGRLVKIWQADRVAVCKRAIYHVISGKLTLTGNPVLTRGADRMAGSRIVFYRDNDKVTCENVQMLITPNKTNDFTIFNEGSK